MMTVEKNCKTCGQSEFGLGKMDGSTGVYPVHKALSFGTPLVLEICINCGEVYSMKVTKPEKFKQRKS